MADFDFIETPENVELEQHLAGIGTRFLAGLVDTLLVFLIAFLLILVLLATTAMTLRDVTGQSDAGAWAMVILAVAFFILHWGYFLIYELVTNGQSPGKKYMKIRVVKEGGGPITFIDVAIRNLLRPVDGFPFYPIAGVCMFVSRKGQRLGDLAAGTVVISEAAVDYSAKSDKPKAIQWEGEPTAADLNRTELKPEEYRLLSNYRARREELTLEARRRVLCKLLPPILTRLGRTLPDESIEQLESQVDLLLNGWDPLAEGQLQAPSPEGRP